MRRAMARACEACLSAWVDFDFATSAEGYERTRALEEPMATAGDAEPFIPSAGYQLARLTRADGRQGLLYLRCFAGVEPWEASPGRTMHLRARKPAPAQVLLDLDAERVTLRVWDLNTGEERSVDLSGRGALELGATDHDFAVLWDVR